MSNMRYALGFALLALLVPACGGGGGGGGGGGVPPAPLTVVQRDPDAGELNVPRTRLLYVRLNRAPNPSTLASNVVLTQGGAAVLGTTVTYDPIPGLIVVDPPVLNASTSYTLTLGIGVTDTNGVALTPSVHSFTTTADADTVPPTFGGATFTVGTRTINSVQLNWSAAGGASAYELFLLPASGIFDPTDTPDAVVAGLTHTFNGLNSDAPLEFYIHARDAAGNISAESYRRPTKTLTSFTQDVYTEIISNRCLLCHVPGGAESPPFFMATRNEAYANLAGATNDSFCTPSAPAKRVVAGDLMNSFLYRKINPSPPCGDQMPRDGMTNPQGYLNSTQVQTIADWILEGALDN